MSQSIPNYQELLDEVMSLSQSLLDHARQGDWDSLPVLMEQRHKLMTEMFQGLSDGNDVEHVTAQMHNLQQMDKEVMLLAADTRNELVSNIQSLQLGRKASHLYSESNS